MKIKLLILMLFVFVCSCSSNGHKCETYIYNNDNKMFIIGKNAVRLGPNVYTVTDGEREWYLYSFKSYNVGDEVSIDIKSR